MHMFSYSFFIFLSSIREIILKKTNYFFFLDSGEETDPEMNEWENQQIRKGVTGAQVIYLNNYLIF